MNVTESRMEEQQLGMYECAGRCHCGRVKFTVQILQNISVQKCNCSICRKTGFIHLIVRSGNFRLIQGGEGLSEYRFNSGVARHLFCRNCGVKAFYVPRSHPEDYSVNLNCVLLDPAISVTVEEFDGQNWDENISTLRDPEQV